MYHHIYVPIDNSDWSNRAINVAVELGKAFGAKLTGCHVYAARLHDYRFKQMEYTLPQEYKYEAELERQRKIHDSLIALGLQLISDSYLDVMARKAEAAGLEFERKMFEGKHYKVLVEDVRRSDYDLVAMGALGMGAVKESQLGSVTERFVRKVTTDTLVVRNLDTLPEPGGHSGLRPGSAAGVGEAIVVGLDGSPQSFHGLKIALALGKALHRPVEAVTVKQEQPDEEIIDTGPAKIYQSDLEIGRKLAQAEGVDLGITLLDGKCFETLIQYCRKERPWLLILGRIGVHSDENEVDLGANAGILLRLAPSNVLVTGGKFYPPPAVKSFRR